MYQKPLNAYLEDKLWAQLSRGTYFKNVTKNQKNSEKHPSLHSYETGENYFERRLTFRTPEILASFKLSLTKQDFRHETKQNELMAHCTGGDALALKAW